ncbi:hypothetical protein OGATHE_005711 [Ogataea polymorpha]|uniref:t-SNARE coiled-coil homology domain-containing protein n=1 Tax=Ogataea polymorpha TaxID=460523 RepID=A0A9P8NUV4_9ASCO|nr:hypothetical protein OGATHE_005711 [Ogataea polymorpha]
MDPFYDVYNDGIVQLERLRSTSPNSLDFNNIKTELIETIGDLTNALEVIQRSKNRAKTGNGNDTFAHIDAAELHSREAKLQDLKSQLSDVLKSVNLPGHYSDNPFEDPPQIDQQYTQQLLQEQDDIISKDLTKSIQNLHQQALTIGNELDYHQELLEDVEQDIDRLNFKMVNHGIKRINRFLETNERGGNCCSHVEWLLLTPHQVLKSRVRQQSVSELSKWEWVQLFHLDEGSLLVSQILSSLVESSVNLAAAQNNSLDTGLIIYALAKLHVLNYPLEVRITCEFFNTRSGQWVSQQTLGEKQNQWFSELTVHLSPQNVEQRRWRRWVRNLHVAVLVLSLELLWGREVARILITKLQVSLESSRRMLRSLSIVTVGQREDNTGSLFPLGLTSSNELVNNDLCSVGKITELSLPNNKCVWRSQGVSVFESHHTVLRKRRVADHKVSLVFVEVFQWNVGLLVLLVVQNSVSLRESTSFHILSRHTNVVSFHSQRTKGQRFTSGPVDTLAALNGLESVSQNSFEVSMQVEVFWNG